VSAYEHPDLVEFFAGHRGSPEELYPSERRFVEPLAALGGSVLDVGCAAGGFAGVWRPLGASRYAGVDASEALIARARELHPDCEFWVGDCADGLPLPDAAADVVAALGWLHWEPRYREALAELWRLAGRYLFFDVRLRPDGTDVAGRQRIAYLEPWDGQTTTPYIAASWPSLAATLVELRPARLLVHGYWGRPADSTEGVGEEVCFATFVLVKGGGSGGVEVALDAPLEWPPDLRPRVTELESNRLEELL
jgi:SAM-dependent methyltransferase